MIKELEFDEYKEYTNKFYILDIGIKGIVQKGKDINGNYIYIGQNEKFILYTPEYTNYDELKNILKKKHDLIRKMNIIVNDTKINQSIDKNDEELYNKYRENLIKIKEKEDIINNYINDTYNELNEDIKKLNQEKNILENELINIYENKINLYSKDNDKWSEENRKYLEKVKRCDKVKKILIKKESQLNESLKNDNILLKKPSIEFNPKKYTIFKKFN